MSPNTLLWLITGCMMLQPLSTDLYLASLPGLAREFGATPAAVQQTLSLFVIGFGCAQLISGPLSDRFGRRPVLLAGLAVYIVASLCCALAPSLSLLVGLRFAQAVGCCTAIVVARAVIRDAYPAADAAHVISKVSSILGLVPLLGPIVGSYLQVLFGWRAAFVFHVLFASALALAAWRWFRETSTHLNMDATRLSGLARIYGRIMRTPTFWAYALPGALSYGTLFIFISGSSFALIQVLAVPTEYFGYCFAFGVVGYLLGTFLCRRLLRTRGLAGTLTVGVSISCVSGLLFAALVALGLQHWSALLGCMFLTGAGHGINFTCAQAGACAPFAEQSGAAAGLFGFFTMVSALLCGTAVGAGLDGTLTPLSITAATAGVLLFASARLTLAHRAAL